MPRDALRLSRAGTVINMTARQQESELGRALASVIVRIAEDFGLATRHDKRWMLKDLVSALRVDYPEVPFYDPAPTSYMSPDGGILSIQSTEGGKLPILISEVKNQGTNDVRAAEGLPAQAKGNAIERLGKNVIGFRAAMLSEGIMPFVCFGYGSDFAEGSSILDRVGTIAMFGELNRIQVVNEGDGGQFNRGSFFFRAQRWTEEEMEDVLYDVASRSVHYYFAKYGSRGFLRDTLITR